MKNDPSTLGARLAEVRRRIAAAAARSARAPESVVLIGVTKTVSPETVAEGIALGMADLGENRVQEAQTKLAAIGRGQARWHLIGHLQGNKAARAVELFDRVHGIDGIDLAERLARHATALGRTLPALIEVNVSGEATKFGVAPDALEDVVGRIARLEGLELDGLMTVGARVERSEDARAGFATLRTLRDRVSAACGVALPELSMGMSGDFEVAIEEGSTMVRVGTALFGTRG